jgi:hypothetical protein
LNIIDISDKNDQEQELKNLNLNFEKVNKHKRTNTEIPIQHVA